MKSNKPANAFAPHELNRFRAYVAKERGRNQIEPDAGHWSKIQAA
jgi:hypothetical protein